MNEPKQAKRPVVLCFSGLDPSGGAGIQADIETLASIGCHCAPVITALTTQDSGNLSTFQPVDADLIFAQAGRVLDDYPIKAIKVGMTGSVANIEVIARLLELNPQVPVIIDPLIQAGGGGSLTDHKMLNKLASTLLPKATIMTPNGPEAHRLCALFTSQNKGLDQFLPTLVQNTCPFVLVTGGHEPGAMVINRLYGKQGEICQFKSSRLPHQYHGSGCTLASALAGFIALGYDPMAHAVKLALDYSHLSLRHGEKLGQGQYIPNRSKAGLLVWQN